MNVKTFLVLAFCCLGALSVTQTACVRNTLTAPALLGGTTSGGGAPTPTPTTVPSAPTTFSISIGSSGLSVSGYVYTVSGGTNGAGGLLTFSAHVGDVIVLPGSGFHPLYFDAGSTTCIYSGATGSQTYTFPAAGTYYFHCGNHASGCSMGNGACGSTNCTAMAGMVSVS